MAEFWLPTLASNLLVSAALALLAFSVQRWAKRPALAHMLWVLVLVKLVSPPLFTVPLLPLTTAEQEPANPTLAALMAPPAFDTAEPLTLPSLGAETEETASTWPTIAPILAWTWLLGSVLAAALSLHTVWRFHRLLKTAGRTAPAEIQRLAERISERLRLRHTPDVVTTCARVSPFVWWRVGSRPRVVLPEHVVAHCPEQELRTVLAHELAHIRRGDHLVRWLEWLVAVSFWWNPVAWWARRSLRAAEELACDALAVTGLRAAPRDYAHSLLNVAALLGRPELQTPAAVSAMTSGPTLEKRLLNLVEREPMNTPNWLRSSVLGLSVALLPLGLAYAQDFNAVERRLGGAVEAGEITLDQARAMLDALRRTAHPKERQAYVYDLAVPPLQPGRWDTKIRLDHPHGVQRYYDAQWDDAPGHEQHGADDHGHEAHPHGGHDKHDHDQHGHDQHQHGEHGHDPFDDDAKAQHAKQVAMDVEAAVKAGKMSAEDAKKKMAEVQRVLAEAYQYHADHADLGKQVHDDRQARMARLQAFAREIEAAVAAGKMSAEAGKKKLEAVRTELDKTRADQAAVEADLEARKEASRDRIRREWVRSFSEVFPNGRTGTPGERSEQGEQAPARYVRARWLDAYRRDIDAAVQAGELSTDQAKEAVNEAYKKLTRSAASDGYVDLGDHARALTDQRAALLKAYVQDLRRAVKEGELSVEDAEKKAEELRSQLGNGQAEKDKEKDKQKNKDKNKQKDDPDRGSSLR